MLASLTEDNIFFISLDLYLKLQTNNNKMKKISILIIALLAIGCSSPSIESESIITKEEKAKVVVEKETKGDDGSHMFAVFQTNKGDFKIELAFNVTPLTVANFVALAEGDMPNPYTEPGVPFYDGLIFHRVIANFMIQGGDPLGTGGGNPGYSLRMSLHI